MLPLVVVGGVPAEVVRRDVHRGGDVVAVCPEQIHPRPGIVVAKTGGILPLQGDDVGPHVAGVLIQLPHCFLQIHAVLVPKEAVISQSLRPGPGGDVLHVAVRLRYRRPVFLQRLGDERRCVCLSGLGFVVRILVQLLCIRKILHQFSDELLLLSGRRTVIRDQFHALPCADVPQVAADRIASTALEIGTFQDQSCHSSSSSTQAPAPAVPGRCGRWSFSHFVHSPTADGADPRR